MKVVMTDIMTNKKSNIKICFTASSGGHLEELACLREVESNFDSFLVTESGSFNELKFGKKTYYVKQINRKEYSFIFKFIILFIKAICILLKEKPDVVISTGALATYPFCLIGKMMGKKVIFVESFARVDNPSLTGKLVYKFADLFIVQWEEMLHYYPKAIYTGGIF